MAEINNFSEITENFDTIKTLLNSIRAQGILNTSDVDKLLAGINTKLEKINTDEDIDLIKIFLSDLKQSLDERHSVLISKFGAIESLFSNLLKNSADSLKSSEIKELFDIVATNLSVFSREVVSQKETLTDITLRLDAMRSDDSQKKDIIKNITLLKNDIERLTNGFDSIVLSLNENFRTVIKTISSIDPTDSVNGFAEQIQDVVNSSNTILSALQMLDKKSLQIEDSIRILATQDDINSAKQRLNDITNQNNVISSAIEEMSTKYHKLDNLADKIDASVSIIAGLKAVISDNSDEISQKILTEVAGLEKKLNEISTNQSFEDFKVTLETVLNNIVNNSTVLQSTLTETSNEIRKIQLGIKDLDINVNFQDLTSNLIKSEKAIKDHVSVETGKVSQLVEVNVTRTLNDISSNAELLGSRIKEMQNAISGLCEQSFNSVTEDIANLKAVVAQIDDNNVSANNAIFSNITDRLAMFENSLKNSLEKQEESVANSSSQLIEQIANIKDLTSILEYKMDASVVETNNAKVELDELKKSIQAVLALDFVNTVKDLRVDLYASKQEISNSLETSSNELAEKMANDLFGKYELLISRLDNLEDGLKQTQMLSLNNLKPILENISSSIVDVLSYVSDRADIDTTSIDNKLLNITEIVKESNLNYVENVRDIVEVIKVQVDNSLEDMQQAAIKQIADINNTVTTSAADLKEEIRYSYNKLLEVEDSFKLIQETLGSNNLIVNSNIEKIISSADNLKNAFEDRIISLKKSLFEQISDFKQEFTCENADKISELKFASENLYNKTIETSEITKQELKGEMSQLLGSLKLNIEELAENLSGTVLKVEGSNKEVINYIKNDLTADVDNAIEGLNSNVTSFSNEMSLKLEDISTGFGSLENSINELSDNTVASLTSTLSKILDNFVSLKALLNSFDEKSVINLNKAVNDITQDFENLRNKVNAVGTTIDEDFTMQLSIIERNFETLRNDFTALVEKGDDTLLRTLNDNFKNLATNIEVSIADKLTSYRDSVSDLFDNITTKNDTQSEFIKEQVLELNNVLQATLRAQNQSAIEQLRDIAGSLKTVLDENIELTTADYSSLKNKLDLFASGMNEAQQELLSVLKEQLSAITLKIEASVSHIRNVNNDLSDDITSGLESTSQLIDNKLEEHAQEVNDKIESITTSVQKVSANVLELNNNTKEKISSIAESIQSLNEVMASSYNEKSFFIINKLETILKELSVKNEEIAASLLTYTGDIKNDVKLNLATNIDDLSSLVESKLLELDKAFEDTSDALQKSTVNQASKILNQLQEINTSTQEQLVILKNSFSDSISSEVNTLFEKINSLCEAQDVNVSTNLSNISSKISEEISQKTIEFRALFEELNSRLDKDEISQINLFQSQLKELSETFNVLIDEAKNVTKSEVSTISETLINNSKALMEEVEQSIEEKINSLLAVNADISAGELQSIEAFANKILEQANINKQNIQECRNLITDLVQKEFSIIIENIEKETDVIVKDLIEQFELLRNSQKDELSNLAVHIEGSVEDYIYNYLNDLKSYLDLKTDNSILNSKIDNLNKELNSYAEDTIETMNKFLETSVFNSSLNDLRSANEILVTSMADKLNAEIQDFIKNNVSEKFDNKLNLFNKKFIDIVVDKYEEIKLISTKYNDTFETIDKSVRELVNNFVTSKNTISTELSALSEKINNSVDSLNINFEALKAQILNKSFDEAFHASINNQITGIEDLVKEQLGYLEDISELCCNNLPELTEMNTLVKHSILQAINDLGDKIGDNEISWGTELNTLKSDIITQFLNIFNQISFVAEQEEILDFIQEKHSELITILSHIVTSTEDVTEIKNNLTVVDNKIDSIKDDIDLINEKITSIISSDGDVNYIYSLQDLESDIANLRVVLNEMKDENRSEEFEKLISSTNDVYKLVESIKNEMPRFELEEFKRDFDSLTEDIVSISTRTNKLILASDESYKTLQDNLQDFKLVINDLDERTKNFAHEAGIDAIDNKLGAINTMIQNGAKTNQVFNQVFEYLAEWVDNAGEQITAISNKVDTLDDIGQIKVMLEDLKAEAEDNTETNELIEALSNVFDKQTKRISSLEAKLDRMIVESTISNKNNKIDMTPFETTLNRFLVAVDDKMSYQQDKIKSLENKLEEVMSMIDPKDTAQLSKKVGGMDRQIAKLNKSIEKIASHVVEK